MLTQATDADLWFSCEVHEDPLLYVRALYQSGQLEYPSSWPEPVLVTQYDFYSMVAVNQ